MPTLKARCDFVTTAHHGAGVIELIDELLEDDFAGRAAQLVRHMIPLGHTAEGQELRLEPHAASVLVAGTSGSGKSSVAKGLVERIVERGSSFS